jgi:hypothetical protein
MPNRRESTHDQYTATAIGIDDNGHLQIRVNDANHRSRAICRKGAIRSRSTVAELSLRPSTLLERFSSALKSIQFLNDHEL